MFSVDQSPARCHHGQFAGRPLGGLFLSFSHLTQDLRARPQASILPTCWPAAQPGVLGLPQRLPSPGLGFSSSTGSFLVHTGRGRWTASRGTTRSPIIQSQLPSSAALVPAVTVAQVVRLHGWFSLGPVSTSMCQSGPRPPELQRPRAGKECPPTKESLW